MPSRTISTALALALLLVTLLVPVVAALPQGQTADTTTVIGTNNPAEDLITLTDALEAAESGDTLILEGIFDLGDCRSPLTIDKSLNITSPANPNLDADQAAQIRNCGPAFLISFADDEEAELNIENIWFRGQNTTSISYTFWHGESTIRHNRFTENVPDSVPTADVRFAVLGKGLLRSDVDGLITIEGNVVDWSSYPLNDQFDGDDNGFAFAAAEMDMIVRDNTIITLGEGIEIEGNFGQDSTYLVEDNTVRTLVPPSPTGFSSGPLGSVAEGIIGGHPAAVKLIANEGTYIVRNNDIALTGLSTGVCMLTTTLNDQALAGEQVLLVENNHCQMDGQLAGLLGGWGQTEGFVPAASLSGALVKGNRFTGTGTVGIGMLGRTSTATQGAVINEGHNNMFVFNDFADFEADAADVGLDNRTYSNIVFGMPGDEIVNLGTFNLALNQMLLAPFVGSE